MCGLVGVLGEPGEDITQLFTDMLYMDTIRGHDSTGVMVKKENKPPVVLKEIGIAHSLIKSKAWGRHVTKSVDSNICYIGHNRAGTRGGNTIQNAHPFTHGHITLTHNGTLLSSYELEKKGNISFGTDSEHIAYSVYTQGIEWTWRKLNGAAALVWWDRKENTLNLIRNEKRPLAFVYTEDKKHFIYASEIWMIDAFASRRGIKVDKKHRYKPNPDFWFKISYENGVLKQESKKLTPRPIPIPIKPPPYTHLGRNYGAPKNNSVVPRIGINPRECNTSRIYGKSLTKETFLKRYDDCLYCAGELETGWEAAILLDHNAAVCESCATVGDMNGMTLGIWGV